MYIRSTILFIESDCIVLSILLGGQEKPDAIAGRMEFQRIFEKVGMYIRALYGVVFLYVILYCVTNCDFIQTAVQNLLDTVSGNTLN